MSNLSRLCKRSSFWKESSSIFDLFGTSFLSREEFDRVKTTHSEVEVNENDIELFLKDFWTSLSNNEKIFKAIARGK
jgi:hypothetical protein